MKNWKLMVKNHKGFTLIELLVVISIIGMLSGIVLVSVKGVASQARDSRRLNDMKQIISGITMYVDKYGTFPPITSDVCCDGWDVGPCISDQSNAFIGALQTSGIMGTVPVDPGPYPAGATSTSCTYGYSYYVYGAGGSGCDASRGNYFVLGIRDLETTNGVHPTSPGFKCPSNNWQPGFEWVTGGFLKDF